MLIYDAASGHTVYDNNSGFANLFTAEISNARFGGGDATGFYIGTRGDVNDVFHGEFAFALFHDGVRNTTGNELWTGDRVFVNGVLDLPDNLVINLLDGDDVVDLDDLSLLRANYGWVLPTAPGAGSSPTETPEPATLILMAAGLPLLLRRRRSRG